MSEETKTQVAELDPELQEMLAERRAAKAKKEKVNAFNSFVDKQKAGSEAIKDLVEGGYLERAMQKAPKLVESADPDVAFNTFLEIAKAEVKLESTSQPKQEEEPKQVEKPATQQVDADKPVNRTGDVTSKDSEIFDFNDPDFAQKLRDAGVSEDKIKLAKLASMRN